MAAQNGGDAPETVTTGQARQGPKGKPVLYVLIASMLLFGGLFAFVMSRSTSDAVSTPSGPGAPVNPVSPRPAQ